MGGDRFKYNCVLWHQFDEAKGTKAYDQSGMGNDGTLYGPRWVRGISVYGLSFDGHDDYVEAPDRPSLDVTGAISVEAWIKKVTDTAYAGIVNKGPGDMDDGYMLREWSGGNIRFNIRLGGADYTATTPAPVSTGEWHHLVGVYDRSNVLLYVDGVKHVGSIYTGDIGINAYPITIGYDTFSPLRHFHGLIDEVRIYSRALSQEEVLARYLYPSVYTTKPPGLKLI